MDEWRPLSLQTSTRPSREIAWPTGSMIPIDVDDQAPIPLIVGIALALFTGFVIIVFCICRRHNLLGGSSSSQDSNSAYQRAPTADGTPGGGGYNTGVGGNSYPMAPVKSMYPPGQGQPTVVGLSGKTVPGGMNAGQQQAPTHPYPSLPPDAYSPPYPMGYAPLPSYMPTSQSSHTSSASGPSSEQGPTAASVSTSVPASTPTVAGGTLSTNTEPSTEAPGGPGTQPKPPGSEQPPDCLDSGTVSTSAGTPGLPPLGALYSGQGHVGYGGQGQGVQGQGMGLGPVGFQAAMMNQRGLMGGQGMGYSAQGSDAGSYGGQGSYPPTMHATAMDYVPGGGFIPRVGSPMPPGTTVTELDQL